MLYGYLPFWGEQEEDFIDKIVNSPLKFDADIVVTDDCKEIIKSMLVKNPEKRVELIHLIQTEYFMMEDEDLEQKIEDTKVKMLAMSQEEEEKAQQKLDDNILISMAALNLTKAASAVSDPKRPKASKLMQPIGKDKTPVASKKETHGTSSVSPFGGTKSSVKQPSGPKQSASQVPSIGVKNPSSSAK